MSTFRERVLAGVRAHPFVHATAAIAIIITGSMLAQANIMTLTGKAPPPPFTFFGSVGTDLAAFVLSIVGAWGWVLLVLQARRSEP